MKEDSTRRAELAKIHIAKKELSLCDSDYRAMLFEIGGQESSGDLDRAGRRRILDHLRSLGWQTKGKGRKPPHNLRTGRLSRQAQLQKIEALLTVGKLPWGYADALALRICKVDKIEFVPSEELYKIITALRKQAIRYGWDLSGEK
jgi:phage gp16-like protein